jgi:dynein heavy chain
MNLQLTSTFFTKICQLYEMIIVRHGLMLVGYSFSGKTASYQVLMRALTDLCENDLNGEKRTHAHILNPKSITMGQLYGQFDDVTHEWSDGVLAVTYRQAAQQETMHGIPDRQWVVFDGPVDAIWIENMNTVLDDNKKLCLMSGEIIAMSAPMTMMFEVQDLAVASPATVSRCGMVYLEPQSMTWRPLMESWLNALPPKLAPFREQLRNLFGWLVPAVNRWIFKEGRSMLTVGILDTDEITRVNALMKLFDCHADEFAEPVEGQPARAEVAAKDAPLWVESLFLFGVVWGVAGVLDAASRAAFDVFFRQLCAGKAPKPYDKVDGTFGVAVKLAAMFPDGEASVYDWAFSKAKGKWVLWIDSISRDDMKIADNAEFANIIVPTIDTVRYSSLLEALVLHGKPTLFVGPTGTGKSAYVQQKLLHGLNADKYLSLFVNFSAQTSANMTQEILDSKVDKRRKGVFGPPMGKKMAVFVDDLNMPVLETYGAQPPIELLRQWMDHGGWYDLKENCFRNVHDLTFVCAMGPPGGGRNSITGRYTRHFNIISFTEFDDGSMIRIFQTILDWWIDCSGFESAFKTRSGPIIAATMEAYKLSVQNLLPTPTKSHYTFNLRDFSRVVQGILLMRKEDLATPVEFVTVWMHELIRVFYDRLTDAPDCSWFLGMTKDLLKKHFDLTAPKVFARVAHKPKDDFHDEDVRHLMYCDFEDPKAKVKAYRLVEDVTALQPRMSALLDEYNSVTPKPMNLVLFLFAIEHISRISRVLKMPRGNALLVGIGGSGRQSLTRLAGYIADMTIKQVRSAARPWPCSLLLRPRLSPHSPSRPARALPSPSRSPAARAHALCAARVAASARHSRRSRCPRPTRQSTGARTSRVCCARRARSARAPSSSSPTRRSRRSRTSRTSTASSTRARCQTSSQTTRRRRSARRCAARRATRTARATARSPRSTPSSSSRRASTYTSCSQCRRSATRSATGCACSRRSSTAARSTGSARGPRTRSTRWRSSSSRTSTSRATCAPA